MKQQAVATSTVIASNQFQGYDMGVDASAQAKLIMLLTQGLYSNPEGSIVREIASNAVDAHQEVGSKEPVIIRLTESEIRFIDQGPGISPERVDKIFSKYLASHKEGTNDQIGYWGLGSKSPLAYTDQFSVITVVDGTEYHYVMHKGEETPTRLDLVGTRKVKVRNGTIVAIPLKYGDFSTFRRELRRQLRYFDNIYFDCRGLGDDHQIYNGKYFRYSSLPEYQNSWHVSNNVEPYDMHISLGNVAYPLANDVVISGKPPALPIAIKFEIGELPITPNREEIIWNKDTIQKVKERYEKVVKELGEMYRLQSSYETILELFASKKGSITLKFLDEKYDIPKSISGPSTDFIATYKGKRKALLKKILDTKVYEYKWGSSKNMRPVIYDDLVRDMAYTTFKTYGSNRHNLINQGLWFRHILDDNMKFYFSEKGRFFVKTSNHIYGGAGNSNIILLKHKGSTDTPEGKLFKEVFEEWRKVKKVKDYDTIKPPGMKLSDSGAPVIDRSKITLHYPVVSEAGKSKDFFTLKEKPFNQTPIPNAKGTIIYGRLDQKAEICELAGIFRYFKDMYCFTTARRNFKHLNNYLNYDEFMKGKTKSFKEIATAILVGTKMLANQGAVANGHTLLKLNPTLGYKVKALAEKGTGVVLATLRPDGSRNVFDAIYKLALKNDTFSPKDKKELEEIAPFLEACDNLKHLKGSREEVKYNRWHDTIHQMWRQDDNIEVEAQDFFKEYLTLKGV